MATSQLNFVRSSDCLSSLKHLTASLNAHLDICAGLPKSETESLLLIHRDLIENHGWVEVEFVNMAGLDCVCVTGRKGKISEIKQLVVCFNTTSLKLSFGSMREIVANCCGSQFNFRRVLVALVDSSGYINYMQISPGISVLLDVNKKKIAHERAKQLNILRADLCKTVANKPGLGSD